MFHWIYIQIRGDMIKYHKTSIPMHWPKSKYMSLCGYTNKKSIAGSCCF